MADSDVDWQTVVDSEIGPKDGSHVSKQHLDNASVFLAGSDDANFLDHYWKVYLDFLTAAILGYLHDQKKT